MYSVTTTVKFDPCSLREHDWAFDLCYLAKLLQMETCVRCGVVKYPRFECGGIDRSRGIWGNKALKEG